MKNLALLFLVPCFSIACSNSPKEAETSPEEPVMENESMDMDQDENEVEIALTDIPQPVLDGLTSRLSDFTLLEADQITHSDGQITYDVEVEVNGMVEEHMFSADGSYLGMEEDDEDEGEEE